MKNKPEYISAPALAKLLKVSRVAIFNRIKKGQIPAKKIGRNYAIPSEFVDAVVHNDDFSALTENDRTEIKKAVDKVIKEYGETLRLLGKE